ncbi:hypothetical protein RJ640_012978 [Escallonia rubra]|uniref:Ty3 transposon capsid-like protein domain-containing protein n=1 Tax=Escallonia rubra TaxID=112253 RepID=A0AA88R7M0_9ASTE|nr:hypothetical protein RJ640_012978 [Escallonia rubra]
MNNSYIFTSHAIFYMIIRTPTAPNSYDIHDTIRFQDCHLPIGKIAKSHDTQMASYSDKDEKKISGRHNQNKFLKPKNSKGSSESISSTTLSLNGITPLAVFAFSKIELVPPPGSKNSLSDLAPLMTTSTESPPPVHSDTVDRLTDSEELVNHDSRVSTPSEGSKKIEFTVLNMSSPARKERVTYHLLGYLSSHFQGSVVMTLGAGCVRLSSTLICVLYMRTMYKVPYASVHFDAQAEHWYAAYIKPIENVDWDSFVRDLYARFSVLTGVSVLGEFNKLHQMGTIDDYFNRFEALRAQVVQEFDYLDESYFCMSFIGGLRPEIQSRVEQFEVGSLTKAIYIARREEVAIQNLLRSHKSWHTAVTTPNYTQTPYKPTFTNPGPSYKPTTPTTTAKPTTFPHIPFKPPTLPYTNSLQKGLLPTPLRLPPKSNQLSTEEHQRRMSQGLCFRCGAKFEPNHKSVVPMWWWWRGRSMAVVMYTPSEEVPRLHDLRDNNGSKLGSASLEMKKSLLPDSNSAFEYSSFLCFSNLCRRLGLFSVETSGVLGNSVKLCTC